MCDECGIFGGARERKKVWNRLMIANRDKLKKSENKLI
jgi:hypothetical protein